MNRATGFYARGIVHTNHPTRTTFLAVSRRVWSYRPALRLSPIRAPIRTNTTDATMEFKSIAGLCLALVGACALAQTPVDVPPWTEESAAPPPAYSQTGLIPIDMPSYVSVKIGIDPATLVVGSDGVVRYVVVMRNTSGSTNAAYEGILCTTGQVKTYARAGTNGKWVTVKEPEWRDLSDNLPSRHAYAIAKQGACDGRTSSKREKTLQALQRGQKAYD